LRRILGIARARFSASADFRIANGIAKVNCAYRHAKLPTGF
jgi:hypothetical protein